MTNKTITIRNENRNAFMHYMEVKAQAKELAKQEKALKAEIAPVLDELATACVATDKTAYAYAGVQVQGKVRHAVYKRTTKQGSVDWEAYARALGATDEGAELYRKASTVQVVVDWATSKQEEELCGK